MKDLTIFILGHEKEAIKQTCSLLKEKPYAKVVPVNLEELDLSKYPEKYNSKFLSENRFFLCDWNIETEYVGVISSSWPRKFSRFNLKMVPDYVLKNIHGNKVIAPLTTKFWLKTPVEGITKINWLDHSEKVHPGMSFYIKELASFMNYEKWDSETFWANTFFCHNNVFFDFLKKWRLMFDFLHLKYQMNFDFDCFTEKYGVDKERRPAYLLERIAMMYFAESSFEIEQYKYDSNFKFKII